MSSPIWAAASLTATTLASPCGLRTWTICAVMMLGRMAKLMAVQISSVGVQFRPSPAICDAFNSMILRSSIKGGVPRLFRLPELEAGKTNKIKWDDTERKRKVAAGD
jgi:hypothetical protein